MAEGKKDLTSENLQKLDRQYEEHEKRQFSCASCRKNWWRVVPVRKPVSRCSTCNTKYNALPRDKEFGIGHHQCECGHTFPGFTSYGVTSPCYRCGREVLYEYFLTDRNNIKRKTNNDHKCSECNGMGGCPNKSAIVNASSEHVSTGSTASSVYSEAETLRDNEEYNEPGEDDRQAVQALLENISRGFEGLDIHSDTDTD